MFKDGALFIVAIYGAVLSTINYWRARQKDRRSIRVVLNTVMPTYGASLGPPFFCLQAVNMGHRVSLVSVLTLQLPDRRRIWPICSNQVAGMNDTSFPARLAEGEVAQRYISYEDVGNALMAHGIVTKTKLTPICEDTTGGQYAGKPIGVDPNELVKMCQS
jgi:hypothetical protein